MFALRGLLRAGAHGRRSLHTAPNLVSQLVTSIRDYGHVFARLDPLAPVVPAHVGVSAAGVADTGCEIRNRQLVCEDTRAQLAHRMVPSSYGLQGDEALAVDEGGRVHLNGHTAPVQLPATVKAPFITVSELVDHLGRAYTGPCGYELQHLLSPEVRAWWYAQIESGTPWRASGETTHDPTLAWEGSPFLSKTRQQAVFAQLEKSRAFDEFLARKYQGLKRYSLEGCDTMLPVVDQLIQEAADQYEVQKVVIGMPHRGRLNLLCSLLEFPPAALFHKVQKGKLLQGAEHGGPGEDVDFLDDVLSHISWEKHGKFHPGQRQDISVSVLNNPSHLEAVNPVSQGKTRAKQDLQQLPSTQVLNLQLHGDAAFAGQGVIQESLLLAHVPQYDVGGTVHVVVNNQLGFTSDHCKGRSSVYASDICKTVGSPVVHVNSAHPEASVSASLLALQYRQQYGRDVCVDLIGYRKYGHNELDEPRFTNPELYSRVDRVERENPVHRAYGGYLSDSGVLPSVKQQKLRKQLDGYLEAQFQQAAQPDYQVPQELYFQKRWSGMGQPQDMTGVVDTGVPVERVREGIRNSVSLTGKPWVNRDGSESDEPPASPEPHRFVDKFVVKGRLTGLDDDPEHAVSWAAAEAAAFDTLLGDGCSVRLAGQDSERGTFSHRHAVINDSETFQRVTPLATDLNGECKGRGQFRVVSSPLSEWGVLGFEYGYSWEDPSQLCLWEAQFGDFHNTAQSIIDTFLVGAEDKWLRQSAMTLLLPHGYDGAGPEHSSARLERFLLMGDQDAEDSTQRAGNMYVVVPTTTAQYFHMLRRQLHDHSSGQSVPVPGMEQGNHTTVNFRRPCIAVTPKTLLKLEEARSPLEHFAPGTGFLPVLSDPLYQQDSAQDAQDVDTLVLCTGKMYYELAEERTARDVTGMAVTRVEQLHPFPWESVTYEVSQRFPNLKRVMWVQEEPQNMGALPYVEKRLSTIMHNLDSDLQLEVVSRPPMAVPAEGNNPDHLTNRQKLFDSVFAN